jgi:putative ATP-dependent endonuclease of OLD family
LENYLHPDAIHTALGHRIVVDDWCDVPDLVAEQVHIAGGGLDAWAQVPDEKKGKKVSQAKRRLNREAMSHMTLPLLQAMDQGGEIVNWLTAVRDRA